MSHKELYYYRYTLANLNAACEDTQQKLRDCTRAYKTIHKQYSKILTNFQNAIVLNASLRQDFKKANKTIYILKLEAQKYKLHLKNSGKLASTNNDKATEIKQNIEKFIFREYYDAKILKLKQGITKVILKYKKEKGKIIKEYKNTLYNITNCIIANQQKIKKLKILYKPRPKGIYLGTPK